MDLESFVTETTIFEIICANCGDRTEEHQCAEDAADEAEAIGFEVIGDGMNDDLEVRCGDCIAKLTSKYDNKN